MKLFSFSLPGFVACGLSLCGSPLLFAEAGAPAQAGSVAEVKAYLVSTVERMGEGAADLQKAAGEYAAVLAKHGGKLDAALAGDADALKALRERMREDYKKMDSYGYETVEGIVAGVDALSKYDIDLDAGVPAAEGPDDVAQIVLDLGNGEVIDKQGNLFTNIIEPSLWGGDARWCLEAGGERYPRPEVISAAAADAVKRIGDLLRDSEAWNASEQDLFGAMTLMTPTLSDYFEDWKESRYSEGNDGIRKFQAVSRISDMRGIMKSCAVMFKAVKDPVAQKDAALSKSVDTGFDGILSFIDLLEKREQAGEIKGAEIDELASQAKDKTDKLVPQIEQAAAVLGLASGN